MSFPLFLFIKVNYQQQGDKNNCIKPTIKNSKIEQEKNYRPSNNLRINKNK
jgi:hypothetical protein